MSLGRDERLRTARAAAPKVRSAFPGAALVTVHLRFLSESAPLHAAQSFTLYPAAQAYFSYPCPYGDCDGIFDLDSEAHRALAEEKTRVTGTIECAGVRSRNGLQRQPCGLRMSYTIAVQCESSRSSRSEPAVQS